MSDGHSRSSRTRLIVGGAAGLALAGLGLRALDRGVFTGATGAAYAPWHKWLGSRRDGNRRPLRSAILAASPHDTQPWLFDVASDAVVVFADRSRHLGTFDPFRREMHLGLGCAIENFVIAARAFGMTANVHVANGRFDLSPGPEPVLAARIELGRDKPLRDRLFDAIPRRRTHRGVYSDRPIAPERLREMEQLVSGPGVRLAFVSDNVMRHEVGELIVDATERIIADPDMSTDSYRWIRTGRREVLARRDGVTIDTSGAGRMLTVAGKMLPDLSAARVDRIWLEQTRTVHTATAALFGVIFVRDRMDLAQTIAAGRAWQRLHLAATARGLAAQPLNQPVEMIDRHHMLGHPDGFGLALSTLARAGDWQPTFVFRLGYAERQAPRSPRRPLEDVVISED